MNQRNGAQHPLLWNCVYSLIRTCSLQMAACFACLLLLLGAATASAQFNASVEGNIQDSSGASIPSAKITLVNNATSVLVTTSSDSAGVFSFPSLGPGSYTVTAKATGFSSASTEITLTAGETRNVPFKLNVGQASTSVTVTTQAPLLDTGDSRNQQTLDEIALENLPLASRNPTALITLTPGVTGLGAGTATN